MLARLLAALITLVVLVTAVILAWPQLFGLEQEAIIAQLVSMRGAAAAAAMLAALLLLLVAIGWKAIRRLALAIVTVLLLFALANTAVLAVRGFGGGGETRQPEDITVLTWNTFGDMPSAEDVADLAMQVGADVISLPETTEQTGIEIALLLREAGNPMWVHTSAYDEVAKARSTTLLIAPRLGAYTFDEAAVTTRVLPTVIATPVEGEGPTIVAVHAVSPVPGQMANWREDLTLLAELCRDDSVILAGDFNATIDHMSSLAAPGAHLGSCTDAAVERSHGALGTWPAWAPTVLGAPIDHVMSTKEWVATSVRIITEHDASGSDHRPVVATLSPRGSGAGAE